MYEDYVELFSCEYATAIVEETGEIYCWCDDLTEAEIEQILLDHPEWHRKPICISTL